jgi:hypothetical protein
MLVIPVSKKKHWKKWRAEEERHKRPLTPLPPQKGIKVQSRFIS